MQESTVARDRQKISIRHEGEVYSGWCSVSGRGAGRMVTTSSPLFGSKTTQVGGSPPESIGRVLLGELVREGTQRPA
jgi:hypothetical protein